MYRGKLVFATHNQNKLKEAQHILSGSIQLLSLKEINCLDELPETHATLEENALEKAEYIYNRFKVNCFSEDSGLEVEALNGEPGVYSARYGGNSKNDEANIALLLKKMENAENRKAQFRAVIALVIDGRSLLFEGVVRGQILRTPLGTGGFGYDPIFVPDGYTESFAQMNLAHKSRISHRKIALEKLSEFLNNYEAPLTQS